MKVDLEYVKMNLDPLQTLLKLVYAYARSCIIFRFVRSSDLECGRIPYYICSDMIRGGWMMGCTTMFYDEMF